ncbi:MAG: hypothetical protein A2X12_01650 [Bacteroidetes bacterium GWE2_29_8]|nr:MAG: hypothetical protein A2X12_01650 [Bacteroidetes bacterium GWE2_29_8]
MNIIIVDDHEVVRSGIKFILSTNFNIQKIEEASNGKIFLKKLLSFKPDIVLMDISMPEMNGIEATEKALTKYPDLKIIALSMFDDEYYYQNMIDAGVKGFVLKTASNNELKLAIEEVLNNKTYFSQELLNIFFKKTTSNNGYNKETAYITKRELEILTLLCEGFTNEMIAEKLFISPKTVKTHRTNLLKKTKSNNTVGMFLFAIKHNIIKIK